MKRHLIYIVALGGLALAGCNGDYDDWASPQSYPQDKAAAAYGITATATPESVITMPTEADEVALVTLAAESADVTGFALRSLTVNGMPIDGTVRDGKVYVSASALSKALEAAAGTRKTTTYDLKVATEVAAQLATGDAVALAPQETAAQLTTQPTPAPDAKGYYLLGDFTANGWDLARPIWMEAQPDGTYKATVTTKSEGDNWYKFYEGSKHSDTDWDQTNAGQMGCAVNGDNALSGYVVWTGDALYPDGVQTPVISGQGTFEVVLDPVNMRYAVTRAEGKYYIIGNPNGWNVGDFTCMAYCEGNNVYSYTTKYTNQWDIKVLEAKYMNLGDNSWGYCWGGENGSTAATGSLINADAGAIGPSEQGGWYTFRFDMNTQTYSWEAIPEPTTTYSAIGLIGDFNSWGGDLELTQLEKAPHNWYVRATIPTDGGLKFRADHDWGVNWGTANVDLTQKYYGLGVNNGDNIYVPAGIYDFYLNDITGLWNIVAVQ